MEYNELQHSGIKGMKWGVRRYQNKDGTLTPAGKKRYSQDYADSRQIKSKKVRQMSNSELKKLNERTRLEQEYSRLHPNAITKGWKYVGAAAGVMGTAIAVYNNSNTLIKAGKAIGDKVIDMAGNMLINDLNKRL